MKLKVMIILAVVMMASSTSFAKTKGGQKFSRPYGMAGCGFGSQLIGKSGGQIFASTTNYSFANQMFGITSGTSNCVDDGNEEVASRMDRFVAANTVAVAGDIARGQGETVASISHLMGCSDSSQVGSALQKNFREIFPTHKVAPNEVTDSIINVIKNDDSLMNQCGSVI